MLSHARGFGVRTDYTSPQLLAVLFFTANVFCWPGAAIESIDFHAN
jgi:hypothetical protein